MYCLLKQIVSSCSVLVNFNFANIYYTADFDGFISGVDARNYFLKYTKRTDVLVKIWDFSDMDKDGKLNKNEFKLANHLLNFIARNPTQQLPGKFTN